MSDKISLVLLTGMPGVGKTTIIKKLYNSLLDKQIQCCGFYTEEIRNRNNGERLGFDVINLCSNERKILARCETNAIRRPKVGKYSVHVDEFEEISLKILSDFFQLNPISNKYCLIIDEIGKMELLSKKFEVEIRKIIAKIKNNNIKIIATIPDQSRSRLKIVDELVSLTNGKIFNITKGNRNQIYNEIEDLCCSILK